MAVDWQRTFVTLNSPTAARNGAGFHPCQGLYHEPKSGKARTALIGVSVGATGPRDGGTCRWRSLAMMLLSMAGRCTR